MYSDNENRINKVVETALKNLNGLADVNTVIGKPIKTDDGDYIFPLSKVTLGILSGGGEYGKISLFKKGSDLPFSAGNGSIISVKPCGFLVKSTNYGYKIITVNSKPYERLLQKAVDYVTSIQNKNETDGTVNN